MIVLDTNVLSEIIRPRPNERCNDGGKRSHHVNCSQPVSLGQNCSPV